MSVRIPSPGTLFAGRYRIESTLGHGAIGVVLAATDETTGVDCAIKLLSSPDFGNDRARLIREARALMLITDPHVVRVFDVGEDDAAGPYLVLERLEGQELGAVARLGEPLDAALVVDYAAQICEALAAAHAVGIIHRDIKPANIFVTKNARGEATIKVLDFGISKVSGDGQGSLTRPDGPLGSPQFISPEQLANPRTVDARTDIWAVGVVMFRLLSGTYPFNGATIAETFALVARGDRPPLTDVAPQVPAALAEVVERCLARDPAGRYASATALREALLAEEASPDSGELPTVTHLVDDAVVLPSSELQTVAHAVVPATSELQTVAHAVVPASSELQTVAHAVVPATSELQTVAHAVVPATSELQTAAHAVVLPSSELHTVADAPAPAPKRPWGIFALGFGVALGVGAVFLLTKTRVEPAPSVSPTTVAPPDPSDDPPTPPPATSASPAPSDSAPPPHPARPRVHPPGPHRKPDPSASPELRGNPYR